MTRTPFSAPRRRLRRALGATLVAALTLTSAACTGDDDESSTGTPGSTGAEAAGLESKIVVGKIRGRLKPAIRKQVVADVGTAVDTWIDGGFVTGDYPRADFAEAFTAFTPGAAARAQRAGSLMSNLEIGEEIESVEATRRTVRVDLLAANGRPAGITAHVVLALELAGGVERTDRVAGRLFLSKEKGTWKVFGYDMSRGRA